MESLKILILGVVAAVLYGVVQSQVGVRVCLEYWTYGTTWSAPPSVIALASGASVWWMGLAVGLPLSVAARAGSRPKRSARQLVFPLLFVVLRIAAWATIGGIAGYLAAEWGWIRVVDPIRDQIGEKERAFLAVLWAAWVAYISAGLEALFLCIRTWRRRAPDR